MLISLTNSELVSIDKFGAQQECLNELLHRLAAPEFIGVNFDLLQVLGGLLTVRRPFENQGGQFRNQLSEQFLARGAGIITLFLKVQLPSSHALFDDVRIKISSLSMLQDRRADGLHIIVFEWVINHLLNPLSVLPGNLAKIRNVFAKQSHPALNGPLVVAPEEPNSLTEPAKFIVIKVRVFRVRKSMIDQAISLQLLEHAGRNIHRRTLVFFSIL